MKFLRKPKVVEAMLFRLGDRTVEDWSDRQVLVFPEYARMRTKYGDGFALDGDYIVRGSCGLYYPVDPKSFADNYEEYRDERPKDY